MVEELKDWPEWGFVEAACGRLPAPVHPETGERLWERGVRLHGSQEAVLKSRARYKQVRGGWRAGKSFIAALALYVDMGWREVVRKVYTDLYGVVGDSYRMAEEEMRHLHGMLEAMGIPHEFHTPVNQSWRIRFPHKGTEVVTLTAADATKIASRPYRGMVLAEAAQLGEAVYLNAKGRVLQTRGWVLIEGTFEEAGAWFYQMAEEWAKGTGEGETFALPTWSNLVLFPGGRDDPAIVAAEREFPPDVFLEKFGGEPQKRSDRVMKYADERVHVRHRFPNLKRSYDPDLPVTLFCDPGTTHAYAVLAVQFVDAGGGRAVDTWVVDAVYRWGRTTEQVMEECAAREWAGNVSEMVMDFAGRQQRSEGPPNVEQWAKGWRALTGRPLFIHAEPVPLAAGYDVHQRCLLNAWEEVDAQRVFNRDGRLRRVTNELGPRLYFDPAAAGPLFGGLVDGQRYRGEYNLHRAKRTREGAVVRDVPLDIDNDAIKALNYGLYWRYGAFGDRTRLLGFEAVPWVMELAR